MWLFSIPVTSPQAPASPTGLPEGLWHHSRGMPSAGHDVPAELMLTQRSTESTDPGPGPARLGAALQVFPRSYKSRCDASSHGARVAAVRSGTPGTHPGTSGNQHLKQYRPSIKSPSPSPKNAQNMKHPPGINHIIETFPAFCQESHFWGSFISYFFFLLRSQTRDYEQHA